jgi:hypothetical protein
MKPRGSHRRLRTTILRRGLVLGAAASALVALGAVPASADYGPGAAYQIEISSNIPGAQGGGIWLWIELMPSSPGATSGTGDYAGSDCGRGRDGHAVADRGEVTWSASGGVITISGLTFNGLAGVPGVNPAMVIVPIPPSGYRHETTDLAAVFPTAARTLGIPPGVGFSQIQVAP